MAWLRYKRVLKQHLNSVACLEIFGKAFYFRFLFGLVLVTVAVGDAGHVLAAGAFFCEALALHGFILTLWSFSAGTCCIDADRVADLAWL